MAVKLTFNTLEHIDLAQISQRNPQDNFSHYEEASVYGQDGFLNRAVLLVEDPNIKTLRRVFRAEVQLTALNSEGHYELLEWMPMSVRGTIKVPTWEGYTLEGTSYTWKSGGGGDPIYDAQSEVSVPTTLGGVETIVYNLTKQTRRSAERSEYWPPSYVFKWKDEGLPENYPSIYYATDNHSSLFYKPKLRLTLGIVPTRARPSGMYRGFRRS